MDDLPSAQQQAARSGANRCAKPGPKALLDELIEETYTGSIGEMVDKQALKDYRDRLLEFEEELEVATSFNDPACQEKLDDERPQPNRNLNKGDADGTIGSDCLTILSPLPVRMTSKADLPAEAQSLIAYRNSESEEAQTLVVGGLDNVRRDLLSDAAKGPKVWDALARKIDPQALRMNLSTARCFDRMCYT